MTEHGERANGYLGRMRERGATPRRATVVMTARWVVVAILAACGGGTKSDTYAKGTHVLEECCEHVQGGGRDACLAAVPHVADPGAAKTATNQQTYACIVDHFTCDPATGHATQASAQAQYDCIEDLQ